MNDLLRDTLAERAASAEPPPLDLAAIVAAGNRRRSRRRALTVFGGAAVTVGGGGLAVAATRKHHVPPPTPKPFLERRVTYALGSVIHYGSDVISVAPHKVNAFVQTDTAFVFLNAKNDIHIADGNGVRSLGKVGWNLTGGYGGNLVAWIEGFDDHYESVVYDVAARRELVRTATGNTIPPTASLAVEPRIVAIEGNTAYFGTQAGLYRWDIAINTGTLIAEVLPDVVRAVAAGQFVYQQPIHTSGHSGRNFAVTSLTIANTVNATSAARFTGQQAFLSPTAKYLVTEPDSAKPGIQPLWADLLMYDATTAKLSRMPDTYTSTYFGQWLDGSRFTAAAERRTSPSAEADLVVVDAATGAVQVVVPKFSHVTFTKAPPRTAPFALPTGRPIVELA